jgi:hypothetical protein
MHVSNFELTGGERVVRPMIFAQANIRGNRATPDLTNAIICILCPLMHFWGYFISFVLSEGILRLLFFFGCVAVLVHASGWPCLDAL